MVAAVGIIGCSQEVEAHSTTIINQLEDDKDIELGLGADLILLEGKDGDLLNKVTTEYKYDFNNDDNHSVYLVGTIKLADIVAKIKGNRD